MQRIQHYSFGEVLISGKKYTQDVIVLPDRVNSSWWRKEGHCVAIEDIEGVLKEAPEVLVIGTGASGLMKVPSEFITRMKEKGIELFIEPTQKACEVYNRIAPFKKTIACLHLTC